VSRARKKGDARFAPAPGSVRVVPMVSGTDVHTPDGKRWHVADEDLAGVVVALDDDDRTPGTYSEQLAALAAERPDRYGPVLEAVAAFQNNETTEEVEQ
jgi:hypothetical protein